MSKESVIPEGCGVQSLDHMTLKVPKHLASGFCANGEVYIFLQVTKLLIDGSGKKVMNI